MMGHLNSFSASGGGNLNKNFPKIQMPGGLPGGMFKLRFDWYINGCQAKLLFCACKSASLNLFTVKFRLSSFVQLGSKVNKAYY